MQFAFLSALQYKDNVRKHNMNYISDNTLTIFHSWARDSASPEQKQQSESFFLFDSNTTTSDAAATAVHVKINSIPARFAEKALGRSVPVGGGGGIEKLVVTE